jgi:hypothetical protein
MSIISQVEIFVPSQERASVVGTKIIVTSHRGGFR